MGNSICLDTDFLVDLLRNKFEAVEWVKKHEDEDILATTVVNVYEIYSGVYKTKLESKILSVKELIKTLKILEFSIKSAEEAGKQNSELEKEGNIIEKRDLFIGSIALVEGFYLKTNNKKHFDRIKGLRTI